MAKTMRNKRQQAGSRGSGSVGTSARRGDQMKAENGCNGIKCEPVTYGFQSIMLDSWQRFSTLVEKHYVTAPAYVFRGQANADWPLLPTLDRREKQFPTCSIYVNGAVDTAEVPPASRDVHLNAFKELVRDKLPAVDIPAAEDDWWALAQHHGLATPLLDWTYYPFVALFFAFEEETWPDREKRKLVEPTHRSVFAVSTSIISPEAAARDVNSPRVFVPLGVRSARLVAQGAVFMRLPKNTDLEKYVSEHFPNDTYSRPGVTPGRSNLHARPILQKIIIPNEGRENCLKWLNAMGINRARLFPDLEGVARYVNDLWPLNFDTSQGYLLRKGDGTGER